MDSPRVCGLARMRSGPLPCHSRNRGTRWAGTRVLEEGLGNSLPASIRTGPRASASSPGGGPGPGLQPVQPAEVVEAVVAHAVEHSPPAARRRPPLPHGKPGRRPNRRCRRPAGRARNRASVTIPAGLVKITSQASGQRCFISRASSSIPGYGPQGIGNSAGARGLLAQEAQVEGDPFIGYPACGSAGADGGEHDVRAVEGLGQGRGCPDRGYAGRRRQADVGGLPGTRASTRRTASMAASRRGSTSYRTSSRTSPANGPERSAR